MTDIAAIEQYVRDNSTEKAKLFSEKLIATRYTISGMQSPAAKTLLKDTVKGKYGDPHDVLTSLPDDSYELIGLQGGIIATMKIPFARKKPLIEGFVKKIDNWATNDSFVSLIRISKEEKEDFFDIFTAYALGEGEFAIRFGVIGLMSKYLDDEHIDRVLDIFAQVTDTAYYVKMALAWAVATSFAKYYDKTLTFLSSGKIADKWTHNKAIQKAVESYRITDDRKTYLRTLKRQ